MGLGKELSQRWSVGASVKTLFSNLQDYQSVALASDLAIAYKKEDKNFQCLFFLKLWKTNKYIYKTSETLPFQLDFGLSKRLEICPSITINYKNIQKWDLTSIYESSNNYLNQNTGSEKLSLQITFSTLILVASYIGKHIQLRMGYNPKRRQGKVDSYLGMVVFHGVWV